MNEQDRPDWLEAHLETLPAEVSPRRDLWPGIEARIRRRGAPRLVLATAAGVLLGAVATWLALQGPEPGLRVDGADVAAIDALSAPYSEAHARYAGAWEAQRRVLDPELAALIERNLEIIARARVEIEAALAVAPDDPQLHSLLRTAYESELDLYRRAQRLGQGGTGSV